jgi:hypothetical protein
MPQALLVFLREAPDEDPVCDEAPRNSRTLTPTLLPVGEDADTQT